MNSDLQEFLKQYIRDWQDVGGVKPDHTLQFLSDFSVYIKELGCEHFDFNNGENGYCGYTAYCYESDPNYKRYSGRGVLDFEFAYGKDFVSVFTMHHEGFWTPAYISLKGNESKYIIDILKSKCLELHNF